MMVANQLAWMGSALIWGILVGMFIENRRKYYDMLMDADREVTFLSGHPYFLIAYGPEQNIDSRPPHEPEHPQVREM